jgi:hypothetical protein
MVTTYISSRRRPKWRREEEEHCRSAAAQAFFQARNLFKTGGNEEDNTHDAHTKEIGRCARTDDNLEKKNVLKAEERRKNIFRFLATCLAPGYYCTILFAVYLWSRFMLGLYNPIRIIPQSFYKRKPYVPHPMYVA